ncbi:hypothetical protein EDD85DRAFT_78644 [Armillaria nabsnona]|nr:hypothetical protein EDD85DRAFT_78644 [Armillaria nabsnona]
MFNEHNHQVLNNCRQTREELLPAIEMNLAEMKPLLVTESYGLQLFFRFIKHIPGYWSTRIDLLNDIRDIILSLRSSLRVVKQDARLDHARLLDKNWVARHRGRSDLRWCLGETRWSVSFVLPTHRQLPGTSLILFNRFMGVVSSAGLGTPTESQITHGYHGGLRQRDVRARAKFSRPTATSHGISSLCHDPVRDTFEHQQRLSVQYPT